MQGWRKRMEDAHISELDIETNTHIFAVFDGHGGKEVALFAKNYFIKELKKNKNFKQKKMKKALIETFMKLDEMLLDRDIIDELFFFNKMSKLEEEKLQTTVQYDLYNKLFTSKSDLHENLAMYSGCTATVCLIYEDKIYFANSGDSRIVISKKGRALSMTVDHKPDLDSEKNRIINANGYVLDGRVNGNLNLSRSIGDLDYKKNPYLKPEEQTIIAYPDVTEFPLRDIDFIILACDGVWDCKSNQDTVDYINRRIYNNSNNNNLSNILEEMMNDIIAPNILTGKI